MTPNEHNLDSSSNPAEERTTNNTLWRIFKYAWTMHGLKLDDDQAESFARVANADLLKELHRLREENDAYRAERADLLCKAGERDALSKTVASLREAFIAEDQRLERHCNEDEGRERNSFWVPCYRVFQEKLAKWITALSAAPETQWVKSEDYENLASLCHDKLPLMDGCQYAFAKVRNAASVIDDLRAKLAAVERMRPTRGDVTILEEKLSAAEAEHQSTMRSRDDWQRVAGEAQERFTGAHACLTEIAKKASEGLGE